MARLSLSLLGPIRVFVDEKPCSLTPRLLGLLAYVATEGNRPHRRESLAALFWPEKPNPVALSNLRSALRDLRAALGEQQAATPLFMSTSSEIQLHERADLWLDAAAFGNLLLTRRGVAPDLDRLQQAAALYRGPFLEGLSLSGSADWEEWLLIRREALQRQMLGALHSLATSLDERREYERAIAFAQQAVELEPWQEEAQRQLMRLLALCGRRSAAIVQYRRCEQVMQRDLGVQLSPETIALYERIRDGAIADALPRPGGGEPTRQILFRMQPPTVPQRLPSPEGSEPPALIARKGELAWMENHLAQALAGQGRVVLVMGEAGSGKTALVEAFCRQAMGAHPDLLIALSRCSARRGAGDPYQPFREIVSMLTIGPGGEDRTPSAPIDAPASETQLSIDILSSEHARRLELARPAALAALAQEGLDLVRLVAHGPSLLARAEACAPPGAAWLARLEALVAQAEGPAVIGQQVAVHQQATGMLHALACLRPLLLVLDDLQWADDPTLDLLFHLGRHLQESPILVVGTFRPEDDSRQADRSQGSRAGAGLPPADARELSPDGQHPLEALSNEFQRQWGDIRIDLAQAEGQHFVWAYVDIQPNCLGTSFREALFRHTGGNALFTVELMRAMQERGDLVRDAEGRWVEGPNLAWEQLPPRVEGSIAQRIGQLTEAQRRLLTVASIEGVDFHAEVLARVLGEPAQAVITTLGDELSRERRLVEVRGIERITPSQQKIGRSAASLALTEERGSATSVGAPLSVSRYRFRHELFQTYLYGRLDTVARAHLHGSVGSAIEELYGEQATQLAWQLARHFEMAGEAAKAANYLLEAGRQAARVGAHREAINGYERALALLAALPDSVERNELELALHLTLDDSLLVTHGWGAPERMRTSRRAYELGQRLSHTSPYRMQALRNLADLSAGRGEHERAIALASELLEAAKRVQDVQHIIAAHAVLAHSRIMRGELAQAWEHAAQAIALGLTASHDLATEGGQARSFYAEITACYVLLARGLPDQARKQLDQVAAIAVRESQHITAYVQTLAAMFYTISHDVQLARRWAEEARHTIEGGDLPEALAWCEWTLGWIEARSGDARQGIARLTATMKPLPGGTMMYRFIQQALLAEVYLMGDENSLAIQTIEQALQLAEEMRVRYYEVELWRLRGESTLRGAQAPDNSVQREAETYFQRAIAVARRQGARLWELRATVSLARLWIQEGRPQEAQRALVAIYTTFNEGFDTPDLVEARTLLDGQGTHACQPGQPVRHKGQRLPA